ncbi:MAG: extracellular solute-binding protein [Anaerolineales bacterium]|nr:extracellular solute-binding protein [Anaerolineales bacterium]
MKRLVTLLVVVAVLASFVACAAPTPEVIEKEVIVEKEVPVTVEVVKEIIVEVPAVPVDYGWVTFLSTQGVPIEEAEAMRGVVLRDFAGQAEFVPSEYEFFEDTVLAEAQAGKGNVDVLGALYGQYPTLLAAGALQDVGALMAKLSDRGIPASSIELGKLGTDTQYYVPWMQATYICAANKVALEYLPAGADVEALTWEQYRDWGKNIYEATGEKKLGFPVDGLMHRFLEGYIYPSYTGGMVTTFRSPEAVEMWEFVIDMWQYVHPQSMVYGFMQEPLLAEEVWVAFDHTARLIEAFKTRPDDFVALPAPSGPKGLGYMPVAVGLAIPVTAPNQEGAEALIEYMTRPEVQVAVLREIGFFPVIDIEFPGYVALGIRMEGEAVAKQAAAANAVPAMLPVGLGPRGGEINKIYRDAFTRIVIDGEDIETVLASEAANLQTLMDETGAPCWPPDPPSVGACQVKK